MVIRNSYRRQFRSTIYSMAPLHYDDYLHGALVILVSRWPYIHIPMVEWHRRSAAPTAEIVLSR